jgi:hypothetical protein
MLFCCEIKLYRNQVVLRQYNHPGGPDYGYASYSSKAYDAIINVFSPTWCAD